MKFESHWPKGSRFSIFSSGGHFVHPSQIVLANLVAGYLGNIPMKFK